MRRFAFPLFLFIVVAVVAYAVYLFLIPIPSASSVPTNSTAELPTPTQKILPFIEIGDDRYNYAYFMVPNTANLTLIPNFSDKLTAATILTRHACISGINSGFYDTSDAPLGLFIVQGEKQSAAIQSALLNGFFSINTQGIPTITTDPPIGTPQMAIQTGPLLYKTGNPLPLAIRNDEHDRRMAVAITTTGSIVFLAVFKQEAQFTGPLLSALPDAIAAISEKERLNIRDAINLDGGSASSFWSPAVSLSELRPVGSLFCLQK